MAHDARVEQQTPDIGFVKAGDLIHMEAGKRGAKGFTLVQNGQPAQARLKAFETHLLEQALVVVHGKPPLLVVIMLIGGGSPAPDAARDPGVVREQAGRR